VDELRKTLADFRGGDASIATLVAAFDAALQTDLDACRELLDELESSGWFPLQLLPLLESRIPLATAAEAPQQTRGPSSAGKTDERENAEGTVFVGHTRRAVDQSATERPVGDGADQRGGIEVGEGAPAPEAESDQASAASVDTSGAAGEPTKDIEPKTPPQSPAPAPSMDPTAVLREPGDVVSGGTPEEGEAGGGDRSEGPPSQISEHPSGQFTGSDTGSSTGRSTGTSSLRSYPPVEGEPEVGALLRQRFLLEKVMGRGGMGVVFKARDLSKEEVSFSKDEKNYVAIKLLNDKFKQHPDSIKALGREFSRTQELRHPNIINLYDFDKDDRGNYFIAMELLQGRPLNDFIRDLRKSGGLPFAEAFPIIEQMGLALAAAHNQTPPIIHSDFKPGNVFIADDGSVKVFDFGIAQAARPAEGDMEKTNFDAKTLGALTPAYASLEMLGGLAPDTSDDIYALAIVAYELLTGQRPFGRRTNAMEAKAKGLTPPRIKTLNRRQWRGLEKGLAFDRRDRTPTVEEFLDSLRPRRSQLSLAIAAGVVGALGVGIAAWVIVIDPWLTQRERDQLAKAVAQAEQPEELSGLLERAYALPDAERRQITNAVIERLAEAIAGTADGIRARALEVSEALPDETRARVLDTASQQLIDEFASADRGQILARLAVLDQLPPEMSREVTKDAEDQILEALVEEARASFEPRSGALDYQRAASLLDQAERIDRDSKRVSDTKTELESTRKTEINRLTTQLNVLSSQGALLPTEDGTASVPALLDILARIDPALNLDDYSWLVSSYLDASKSVENDDPALAQRYIEQALALFPKDPDNQLRNQLASIRDLARQQARAATLAQLQARIRGQLDGLAKGEPSQQVIEDLRQLRRLAPDDPLLTEARTAIQGQIDAALPPLLERRDWDAARRLVERWPMLVGDAFVASRTDQIDASRRQLAEQIDAIAERIRSKIAADDLTGANEVLAELEALAPDAPEATRAKSAIDRGYLKLARQARGAGDWERARTLAQQGRDRADQRQLKLAFEDELTAIDNDQAASEQAIAEAERDRREAERQARIAEIEAEFKAFVGDMAPTEADAQAARALLDRLGGLDANNDLLTDGPALIAQRFVDAAQDKADTDQWQEAIDLIRTGQRVLPRVASLDSELATLQADYERYQERQRLAAIDAQVNQVRGLIAESELDDDWGERVSEAFAELARVAEGDRSVIEPLKQQLAARFEDRIDDLRDRNLFTAARNQLQLWRRLIPEADAQQARVSASLDAAVAAWEQAEDERRRQAEVAALTQTLRTQTEANQPQDAERTLGQLRERLGDADPFVTTEGPGLIADAYVRLAEQSAKRGVTDTALALLDKAAALVPDRDLSTLRERIEREAERDRIGALIASTDADELPALSPEINALQQRAPDDFDDWQGQWAKTLVRRIEMAPSTGAGQALLDAALTLFPDDPEIAKATVPKPVESRLIAEAKDALGQNRLTAAGELLTQARRETPGHPELAALEAKRDAAVAKAEKAKQLYQSAIQRGQFSKAQKALAIAQATWVDDPDIKTGSGTQTGKTTAPKTQAPSKRDNCNPRFAGHGRRSAARCYDTLDGEHGPPLVVIPAGGGSPRPFAITRYEISIGDYNRYCQLSGECRPISGGNKMPLTGVTKAQADAYARWLSRVTGASYRLPTDNEWLFAARSDNSRPSGTANCLLRSGGQIIKGGSPNLVSTGPQNNWGLVNHVGNVQEWTISGGSLQARGGYFGDDASSCSVTLRRPHTGSADRNTGFRLVREIKG